MGYMRRLATSIAVAMLSRSSFVVALMFLFLSTEAIAQRNLTGRWTPIGNSWHHEQIHMALLRGDANYHSKLLSWGHHSPAEHGKLWGWNPAAGTADNDCSGYPLGQFSSLDVGSGAPNIFCSGHSTLANGDLLITGGHDQATDVGLRQSIVFRANATLGQQWVSPSLMTAGRWYPTNTTLPSGHVLTFAGAWCYHAPVFGGTAVPQDPSGAATDDINRFGLTTGGQSLAVITRLQGESNWPDARDGHSAVWHPGQLRMIVFGGRQGGTGSPMKDTWGLQVATGGFSYSWNHFPDAPIDCQPRTRHSAIMRGDMMIVYGGLASGGPQSDVWELKRDPQGSWQWNPRATSGSSPGARYGHTAVYDADNDRMLVFGGRNSTTNPGLANDGVYELKFSNSTWSLLTPESSAKPSARDGHTLVVDRTLRTGGPFADLTLPADQRMVLFGGQEGGGGSLKRDVWVLWINRATNGSKGAIQWVSMGEPAGPSARTRHAAFWDLTPDAEPTLFDRMIVSGGDTLDAPTATTWSLESNLGTWTAKATAAPPLAGHSAVYHPTNLYADQPELYDAVTGTWAQQTGRRLQKYYPFMFVLPSGNLLSAGPNDESLYNPGTQTWSTLGVVSGFDGGSAVTYEPGKIMKCGSDSEPVRGVTKKIIIDASDAVAGGGWVTSENDMQPRTFHNTTVLPSGQVLVTGGLESRIFGLADTVAVRGARQPQLWTANAGSQQEGQWGGLLAEEPVRRGYHSTAILLPDGRVLSAGGESPAPSAPGFNPNHDKPTIFCPPYLFNPGGSLATRPTIYAWHDTVGYGQTFKIWTESPESVLSVCLIRPGAVTHAFSQDQRRIPIAFQVVQEPGYCEEIQVTSPANANMAPPGDYLLFILKQNPLDPTASGVPAVAQWVRVREEPSVHIVGNAPPVCNGLAGGPGPSPQRFALHQNRPNPFAGITTIRFDVAVQSRVKFEVFDLQGRHIRVLVDRSYSPGLHAIEWDQRDERGNRARPGVYLYRLTAGSFRDQKQMVLLP